MKLDKFEEIDIQTKIIIWLWNIFGFEGFVFRDAFAYQKDFLQIISKMYNIERIVLGQKRRSFDAFLAKGSKPWCCSESQRRFPSNGQKHLQLARSKRCQRESLWRGRDAFETRLTEEFAVHWFQKICLESPRSRSKDKHPSILVRSWSCDQDNNSTTTCFPLLSNEGRMAEGTTFEDGGPEREKRWKDYMFPMFFWLEKDGHLWILLQLGDSGDDVEVEAEAWVAVKCKFQKWLKICKSCCEGDGGGGDVQSKVWQHGTDPFLGGNLDVLLCIHLHGTNFLQDSRVGQKEEMATWVQLLSLKWLATLNIDKVDSQRFVGNTMPHQTKQRQSIYQNDPKCILLA